MDISPAVVLVSKLGHFISKHYRVVQGWRIFVGWPRIISTCLPYFYHFLIINVLIIKLAIRFMIRKIIKVGYVEIIAEQNVHLSNRFLFQRSFFFTIFQNPMEKSLCFFCWGNPCAAYFRVGLHKYVIPAPLYRQHQQILGRLSSDLMKGCGFWIVC